MRLMGSVLVEYNETISSRKRIFTNRTFHELIATDIPANLIKIATERRQLIAA